MPKRGQLAGQLTQSAKPEEVSCQTQWIPTSSFSTDGEGGEGGSKSDIVLREGLRIMMIVGEGGSRMVQKVVTLLMDGPP